MDGQPAFLITILTIVAILQVETHAKRTIVPEDLLARSVCTGVDLNVGASCSRAAIGSASDAATSSP
jgi:hypothetical protein